DARATPSKSDSGPPTQQANQLCNSRRTARFLPMIPALILILSAVIYRIAAVFLIQSGQASWLANFAPLAAIALCGAVYFPLKLKFTVPLSALFLSDLFLNYYYRAPLVQAEMIGHYLGLA